MAKKTAQHPKITLKFVEQAISDPSRLNDYDDLTKYILAKCLSKGIADDNQLQRYIKHLNDTGSYKYFQSKEDIKETAIFTENNDEFVRFLARTEDLDYQTLTSPLGFDIREAEEDMFYVRRKENDLLAKYLSGDEHVLIKGLMKIGKTRLVFDELRKLRDYYVFSLCQAAFYQIHSLVVSDDFNKEKRKLVWFIDDLQYFSSHEDRLWSMYEKLTAKLGRITVVATLRSYEKIKSRLIKDMAVLNVSTWTMEEANELVAHYGYPISRFAGTPFSLIKDIERMKQLYDSYKEHRNMNRVYVMRYLKLLYQFAQLVDSNLLEKTFLFLREKSTMDDFELSLFALEKAGFIRIQDNVVSSWEPYLEQIVSEKDYRHLFSDMAKLIKLFAHLRKFSDLNLLAQYFYYKRYFAECIECNKILINNISQKKDNFEKDSVHYNLGISFYELARLENSDERLYEEAIEHFKLSLKYREDKPDAYLTLGLAQYRCAMLRSNDERLYLEAIDNFQQCIKYNKNDAEAYYNWSICLYELSRIRNEDEDLYEDALNKCKLALQFKNADKCFCYGLWGDILYRLARIKKSKVLYFRSYDKYELASQLKKDYGYAYASMAKVLEDIAEIEHDDEELYFKAIDQYKLAIKYEKDSSIIYYNWATLFLRLANIRNEDKLYREAIRNYKLAIRDKKDLPEAYLGLGSSFIGLAKIRNSHKLYLKAAEQCETAIKYKKDYAGAYFNWALATYEHSNLTKKEKLGEDILEYFVKSFLLSILQGRWEQAYKFALSELVELAEKYDNRSYYIIVAVFFYPVAIIHKNMEVSPRGMDYLKRVRGVLKETDIVINAILEDKSTQYDVDEVSNDQLLLKTAVFLAKELTSKGEKR